MLFLLWGKCLVLVTRVTYLPLLDTYASKLTVGFILQQITSEAFIKDRSVQKPRVSTIQRTIYDEDGKKHSCNFKHFYK